jgi:hypothetical protein
MTRYLRRQLPHVASPMKAPPAAPSARVVAAAAAPFAASFSHRLCARAASGAAAAVPINAPNNARRPRRHVSTPFVCLAILFEAKFTDGVSTQPASRKRESDWLNRPGTRLRCGSSSESRSDCACATPALTIKAKVNEAAMRAATRMRITVLPTRGRCR